MTAPAPLSGTDMLVVLHIGRERRGTHLQHRRTLVALRRMWVDQAHSTRRHGHVEQARRYLSLAAVCERLLLDIYGEATGQALSPHWELYAAWLRWQPGRGTCPVCVAAVLAAAA